LSAAEGKEFAKRGLLSGGHDAHAGLTRARGYGGGGEDKRGDADPASCLGTIGVADDMPAFDMAEFMRNHALHFIR
jgi:hypothetical protein